MGDAGDNLKLLIVDDEEAIRSSLSIVFEDDGWQVSSAASAEEAYEVWLTQEFDLLLVDKNMPGKSGVDFIEAVRNTDQVVTIMLLTGYANDQSAHKALNLGIDSYAEKPVRDAYRLAMGCRQLISRRALRLEREREALSAPKPPGGTVVWCRKGREDLLEHAFAAALGSLEFVDSEEALQNRLSATPCAVAILDHVPGDVVIAEIVTRLIAEFSALAFIVVGEMLPLPAITQLIGLQGVSLAVEPLESAAFSDQLETITKRLHRAVSRPTK